MRMFTLIGNVIAGFSVIFFLYLATSHSSAFESISADLATASALLRTLPVYVAGMTVGAFAWMMLMRSVGQHLNTLTAIHIIFASQAAKYVPGNVAHHIGRVVLTKRRGLAITPTLFTMLMETLWVTAIAALLALAALLTGGGHLFSGIPNVPQWWVFAGITIAALLAPLIGHRAFNWTVNWWASRKGIAIDLVRLPPLRTFWLVGLLYIANFFILGVMLQLIATQIFDAEGGGIVLLTGIFAVAWIVGFITPGAPAGLGVREIVLVAALTPIYGQETAIGVAAVLRVATMLGDGLAFLIGLGLGRLPSVSATTPA